MPTPYRKAENPPPPLSLPPAADLLERLERTLQEQFAMPMLSPFSVIVEGTMDRDYIIRAADLESEETGVDLLNVPGDPPSEVSIVTPASGACCNRGGAPRCVALAGVLYPYASLLECFNGLLFVLDHDDEGRKAERDISAIGFEKGKHVITLDPAYHRSIESDVITIENLLSLRIQNEYFRDHQAWCCVEYRGGSVWRYDWHNKSKPSLREYVLSHATGEDVVEVRRLLRRIRRLMGLPVDEENV